MKTLALSGALAVSMVLTPALSMADNGDRDHHRDKYSVDAGKHHNKGHKIDHRQSSKHYYSKSHHGHNRHVIYAPAHHKHRSDRGHQGHTHVNYVVNEHYHSSHHHDLDRLRLMIGLHTDNFDIFLHE